MDHNTKHFWLIVAGVVLAALAFRAIVNRGKGWMEGVAGIASGLACAAMFGGIAHLMAGPPGWASAVLTTPESWTAACAAVGAIIGDRLMVGVMVEAKRFQADPSAWIASRLPWLKGAPK